MLRTPPRARARVLLVDLNNFARFPTLPVGLITAVLRRAGHEVRVLSPLAVGVKSLPRPGRARPWGYWDERCRWWSATTPSPTVRAAREALQGLRAHRRAARGARLHSRVREELDRGPNVVLVSTYLMYHDAVSRLCASARERGIPVVVGGPAFHTPATRAAWLRTPGLTGILAGEAEGVVAELVEAVSSGEEPRVPGYTAAGGADAGIAPPLAGLGELPFPDYDDFPWELYPNRIVSVLTARGCGWGACRFCSDVVTVAGRGFRSRELEDVVDELAHHHARYAASLFCFSDLKLNSSLEVWRGLHERLQGAVPGARWTCAVHAGPRADEGLSAADLRSARRAGLARVTTGLESASPRLLDSMRKGTSPEAVEEFLAHAREAEVSTRLTAFTGYPGEEASDLEFTTRFLERNVERIGRVHLARLVVQDGTPLERDLATQRLEPESFRDLSPQPLRAETRHTDVALSDRSSRRAAARLLRAVHRINRRPLASDAAGLEGAM
jgi:radical SAM superfamily enzyme YgiQ (UPF0313 family)